MNPAKEVTVQLIGDDRKPLRASGVEIDIQFYVHGRPRYTFTLGRTDEGGVVHTPFSEIERQLQENRSIF